MQYYLFSFICLFLSCASQGRPTGGPIDSFGPKIIASTPTINSTLSSEEKIIIFFDELINPISVVNAINIFPENKFSYRVIGKKIIIEPKEKWIDSNVIKIKLSRKISDYQNNFMTEQIQLAYELPPEYMMG